MVNPAGFYPTRFAAPITANDAVHKLELLRRVKQKPLVIILGSSKSMRLSPRTVERLTGWPSFNAATSAAVPNDMLQMARSAFAQGIAPQLLLVGVDVEMFHNGNRPTAHLPSLRLRAEALLSIDQAQESFRSLRYMATNSYPPPRRVFDPDGGLREPVLEEEIRRGVPVFARDLPAMITAYDLMWKTYTGLSPSETAALAELLRSSRDRGIRVVVFLTPTHPSLEQALLHRGYRQRKAEVEDMVRRLCAESRARYLDLSTTQAFGGDVHDFYDGMHVGEDNAALIVRRLVTEDAVQ